MPEQRQRPGDIVALVASINRHQARALRLQRQMHEWAIVSREVIAQSRELLVAVEHTLRGAAVGAGRRGAVRADVTEAPAATASIGSEAPRR
ncbi:MAG TPA: hypothetical protein VLX44_20010 [Xanthobacteraceae bacterium]|nr:hypothetical protein [Xanthobacteraceae bacterium]